VTKRHGADAYVLAAASIWGIGGYFIRRAALPTATIAFFRMAVPLAAIILYFLFKRHRIPREGLGLRLFASLLNAARMYFYFLAFQYTTVSIAVVALYTWPIFATLFALPLNGEPISRRRLMFLGLAFAGVLVLYLGSGLGAGPRPETAAGVPASGGADALGISSMLLSAAIYAVSVVLLKRARAGGSSFETTFFQNLAGALIFGVVFLVAGPAVTAEQLFWAVMLGGVVGLLGFTLFFIGLHRVSTARASNLAYFEIPVAVAVSALLLGEPLGWSTVAGGIIISVAVIASRRVT